MALLAALFDCILDVPAFPDLISSLTPAEHLMLGCRLGWLPVSPTNRCRFV